MSIHNITHESKTFKPKILFLLSACKHLPEYYHGYFVAVILVFQFAQQS